MKIGFLGNANNYPFIMAQALRRMGHEVIFLVDQRDPLDRPEDCYPDISYPYPDWIYDVSPVRIRDLVLPTAKRTEILRLLRSCDALVLNQRGPSFLPPVKRPAVVLLTGSDLQYYGDLRTVGIVPHYVNRRPVFIWRKLLKYAYKKLIQDQRAGIRAATAVIHRIQGLYPLGDALLEEIGVQDGQRVNLMMVDLEKIHQEPLPNNNSVRAVCVTRLIWRGVEGRTVPWMSDMDYKGSDIMVRGLGLFHRKNGIRLDIRIVKKGMNMQETMRLVEEEGIADQVTWLDGISQREVLEEFKRADIVFEQFGSTGFGMAALDAMAMGRPVIMNGRPEIMERITGPLPICQARTPEEVCTQLQRLVSDPAERERVGSAGRKYVEEYFSADHAARICLDRLNNNKCL